MTSDAGFDLRLRQWIPVVGDTPRGPVGFEELFLRAHEFADVDVPLAPAAAGLWRVLYLVAARVSGLDEEDLTGKEFERLRRRVLTEKQFKEASVREYFEEYRSRFNLFGKERPWLQDPRLATQSPASSGLNKIIFGRPAGNNQVWFGHHMDDYPRPIPAGEAAWHLLAALYYGPSGRCTTRTVKARSEGNTAAGPLRGALSCHPLGGSLFESLIAGIPAPPDEDDYREGVPDEAPWEAVELPDPLRGPTPLRGAARALTGGFQHAVLLVPDEARENVVDATLTWAWREKGKPGADPYLIYQTSKKGEVYPRPASTFRALWRDLDALLLKNKGGNIRRPQIFDSVEQLPPDVRDAMRVRVFGFDQDGQTRDRQFFTQTTSPVLRWLEDSQFAFVQGIEQVHDAAEKVGLNLVHALKDAWVLLADPDDDGRSRSSRRDAGAGPWVATAEGRYWPLAERVFWRTLDAAEQAANPGPIFAGAPRELVRSAERVYDDIADQIMAASHPRTVRALARHRYRLRLGV
jgi:CRISPR system Cascade subunit CasA